MEGSFTGGWQPELTSYRNMTMSREDYVADAAAAFYAAAFGRCGKLGWKGSDNVSDAYLAYLQRLGVSYLFAGKTELNLKLTLDKLKSLFGIKNASSGRRKYS